MILNEWQLGLKSVIGKIGVQEFVNVTGQLIFAYSGCDSVDVTSIDCESCIMLMQRGSCDFYTKGTKCYQSHVPHASHDNNTFRAECTRCRCNRNDRRLKPSLLHIAKHNKASFMLNVDFKSIMQMIFTGNYFEDNHYVIQEFPEYADTPLNIPAVFINGRDHLLVTRSLIHNVKFAY